MVSTGQGQETIDDEVVSGLQAQIIKQQMPQGACFETKEGATHKLAGVQRTV